jgi:hypothetical protein
MSNSSTGDIIARIHAFGVDLVIRRARYSDGALALVVESEQGEPWGKLSVHLPETPNLAPGEFCVKLWGENEAFREPALACGAFVDTGVRIPVGAFAHAEVWRLAGEPLQEARKKAVLAQLQVREIGYVDLEMATERDLVADVLAWAWLEQNASFERVRADLCVTHEFMLDLALDYINAPAHLAEMITAARERGLAYLAFVRRP